MTTSGQAEPEFRPFTPADGSAAVAFLCRDEWPYHGATRNDPGDVLNHVADGFFTATSVRTFWIVVQGEHVGMIRLFDLEDETPMFDLRIATAHRGRGLGQRALSWLADYTFGGFPDVSRIEGTTRQDNEAMRRTFRACGFAKEAHYRDAWPDENGERHDAVGYSMLRRDWATGVVTIPAWEDEPGPSPRRT